MNITFQYQIINLDVGKVGGMSDVVLSIHYRVIATGEGLDVRPVRSGVVSLETPDGSAFTEFNSLLKDQVENWLKQNIDTAAIEESLTLELKDLSIGSIYPVVTASKIPSGW